MPKYSIDLFDNEVLPMQKEAIRCMYRKALAVLSSAVLKLLLENQRTRRFNIEWLSIVGDAETTFQLCVKEVLLIWKQMSTLNTLKEVFESPLFTQLDRGYNMKLPNNFWTVSFGEV